MKMLEAYKVLSKGYAIINDNKNNIEKTNKSVAKILNLKNVRELVEGQEIEYSLTTFEQKYQKNILYVQKKDIVIPVAVGTGGFNIMYIENEPKERYIYNNSCLVLRIKEDIISSKFVYLQLMTNKVQKKLLSNAKGTIIKHITKKDILSIEIPDLETEKIKEICRKYDNIKNKERKLKCEKKEFWNSLNKLNN